MDTNISNSIKVWDPLIRVFHWSLVFFFILAYATEDDWMTVHSYAGYCIAGLILFRLIWGVIGTRHARFTDFITTPSNVIGYMKQLPAGRAKRYIGHNPAGAAMIVVLLVSLSMTLFSGASLYATEGQGPLVGTFMASWSEDALEEVHEFFANFTLLMVVAHVMGVLLSSLLHRENLVKSMITGRKAVQVSSDSKHDDISYERTQS
ncbi:MAG: cytochrome B [Halieaceae bacterium]|jgi:cytochrome b|nr:cytochrome B [Halieaceae bacterium]